MEWGAEDLFYNLLDHSHSIKSSRATRTIRMLVHQMSKSRRWFPMITISSDIGMFSLKLAVWNTSFVENDQH